MTQKAAFAFGVPSYIYRFHPSTRNSTFLCHTQVFWFWEHFESQAFVFHSQLQIPPTYSLRPIIPNNACPTCLTAAAGTGLAGTCSESFVIFFTFPKSFTTKIAFITHAMELDQACAHCPKFLTAAIRRSLDRVSVLVRLNILSDQLRIGGLVSLYLTNYLILRRLIIQQLLPLIFGIWDRTGW